MSKKYVLEIDLFAFANDEVDLSIKVNKIERALNALDFVDNAEVKPLVYLREKGLKAIFPKPIRIEKIRK